MITSEILMDGYLISIWKVTVILLNIFYNYHAQALEAVLIQDLYPIKMQITL